MMSLRYRIAQNKKYVEMRRTSTEMHLQLWLRFIVLVLPLITRFSSSPLTRRLRFSHQSRWKDFSLPDGWKMTTQREEQKKMHFLTLLSTFTSRAHSLRYEQEQNCEQTIFCSRVRSLMFQVLIHQYPLDL